MRKYDQKWMSARAWYTAGRTFAWECPQCGAKLTMEMADKCNAPLEKPCPGFERIEEAHKEFERLHPQMVTR